jgi:hypothetical protein
MSGLELIGLAALFFAAVGAFAWLRKSGAGRSSAARKRSAAKKDQYRLIHRSIKAGDADPLPPGNGYYVLRVKDNRRLTWQKLPPGFLCFSVAGTSSHQSELQDDAFAPGRSLALVPEPDNLSDPNAVRVCSPDLSTQIGYVPRDLALKVAKALSRDEIARCISLWEVTEQNRRITLRVLVVSRSIDLRT